MRLISHTWVTHADCEWVFQRNTRPSLFGGKSLSTGILSLKFRWMGGGWGYTIRLYMYFQDMPIVAGVFSQF